MKETDTKPKALISLPFKLHPAHMIPDDTRTRILSEIERMGIERVKGEAFLVALCEETTKYASPLRDLANGEPTRKEVKRALEQLEKALARTKDSGAMKWLNYAKGQTLFSDFPTSGRMVHALEQITREAIQEVNKGTVRKGRPEMKEKTDIVADIAQKFKDATGGEITATEGTGFDYILHTVWDWLCKKWRVDNTSPNSFKKHIEAYLKERRK
ncbi:hypothetical protein P3T73_09865 [Kiritimatiellota bacterium B12222]|nr:hypothetical protein P3T73_09865 [Kiritimatiellota bacterium B12222]